MYILCAYINLHLHLGMESDHFPSLHVMVVAPTSWTPSAGVNVNLLPSVSDPVSAVVPHGIDPGCSQNTVRKYYMIKPLCIKAIVLHI